MTYSLNQNLNLHQKTSFSKYIKITKTQIKEILMNNLKIFSFKLKITYHQAMFTLIILILQEKERLQLKMCSILTFLILVINILAQIMILYFNTDINIRTFKNIKDKLLCKIFLKVFLHRINRKRKNKGYQFSIHKYKICRMYLSKNKE